MGKVGDGPLELLDGRVDVAQRVVAVPQPDRLASGQPARPAPVASTCRRPGHVLHLMQTPAVATEIAHRVGATGREPPHSPSSAAAAAAADTPPARAMPPTR